ncbi:MAG TPA: hypothetical protein VEC17_03500 [Candidatus Binatia bacterium]|nr:hypothetical protein [Candidatus Binatia bacterium]
MYSANLKPDNSSGFGMFEGIALVFMVFVMLIVTVSAFSAAKEDSRDAHRVADVMQLRQAMKLYMDEYGQYPQGSNGIAVGVDDSFARFIAKWPTPPKPADGSCQETNNVYYYELTNSGSSYEIRFCLGNGYKNLRAGVLTATPDGYR